MNHRLSKYGYVAAIVLLLAGCVKARYEPDPSDAPSGAPLVTVIYDPIALGDRSYNDLIYAGVERAVLSRGIRSMQLSPATEEEGLAALEVYFGQMLSQHDTVRRLLIVAGASYDEYLRRNSSELEGNPLSDLLYLETAEPLAGKGSTVCLPYYGAMYEAGAVARSYSGKTLLVAANPFNPVIQESVKGFTEGFNADYTTAESDAELRLEWLSDESGGGFAIEDEQAIGIVYGGEMFAFEDLVFPVCGGAAGAFHRLSNLFGGFDYIGIDVVSVSPHCPFSVVKHIDRAVDICIGQWLSSEGMPKHQTLSFADGWTEVVLHPYTEMQQYWAESVLTPQALGEIHEDAMKKEAGYE